MIATKKAAGRAATTATTTRTPKYPLRNDLSRSSPHFSSLDPTAPALGYLILYLVGRNLPGRECRTGWALAERWLRELVAARHWRGAA